MSLLPTMLFCTSQPLPCTPTPVPLHFSQLRTGLFALSERQWKETPTMVVGMSRQMDKRKEDGVWNQERCKPVRREAAWVQVR